jgi:hypothetical protein
MRQLQCPHNIPGPMVNGFLLTLICLVNWAMNVQSKSFDPRGIQFVGFKSFASFKKSPGEQPGEVVLTSKPIHARIAWDELIVSWNAVMPAGTWLKIEARAIQPDHTTKWYVLGLWSGDPERYPRESVPQQRDEDGDVKTDTLVLKQPADRVQVRLTLGGEGREELKLKFLSLALLDSQLTPKPLTPNRTAWGRTIDVPERSQMAYENGGVLCSPATVSMLLAHWARELNRPSLDRDVPEVVKGVYDPKWEGTGNWVFNTAYAGSLPGMRAYTARLSDVAELEAWIAQRIPVGLSLCYNRLRGKGREPSGHLVVCVGFTEAGDVVVNDPGTSKDVRKTFPRANLIDAWAHSKNAAYFIYPENASVPRDRFGHWGSWTAKRRISFVP